MKSKRLDFLKHNRQIKIEGSDIPGIVNKCINAGIDLNDLKWNNQIEVTVSVAERDHIRLKEITGYSYRITTISEGGLYSVIQYIKHNKSIILGAFLLGALIFYQSLFVAEIRIEGYERIPETEIRNTLKEAGLYEGARKPKDYIDIKAALYEGHKEITWASIFEEGRLIKVSIAEAGKGEDTEIKEDLPVSVVASRAGMVEKIIPLEGNAKVKKGDYVNEGDVLISGIYKYKSTDYSKGDRDYYMYCHAKGQVMAKVPKKMSFYIQKSQRELIPTGKQVWGLCIDTSNKRIDTAECMNRYKFSVRKEYELLNATRAVPGSVCIVRICEVKIEENKIDKNKLGKVTEAAVRQYEREEMKKGEEILEYTIDYSETDNLIKADVFMELLTDIGEEKPIKTKRLEKTEKDT